MNLKKKLITAFLGVALLVLAAGAAGIINVNKVGKEAVNIGRYKQPLIKAILKLQTNLSQARIKIEEVAQMDKSAEIDPLEEEYKLHLQRVVFLADAIKDGAETDKETIYKSENPIVQQKITDTARELIQFNLQATEMIRSQRQSIERENLAWQEMENMETAYHQIMTYANDAEAAVLAQLEKGQKSGMDKGKILEHIVPHVDMCMEIKMSLTLARMDMEEYMQAKTLSPLPGLKQEFARKMNEMNLYVRAVLEGAETEDGKTYATTDREVRKLTLGVKEKKEEFIKDCQALMTAKNESLQAGMVEAKAMKEFEKSYDRVVALMEKTEAAIDHEVAESIKKAEDTAFSSQIMMVVLSIVCVTGAVILGIFMARSIANPIREVVEVANHIAEGNLTDKDIPVTSRDEVGMLANTLNDMKASLTEMIQNVKDAAVNVSGGSNQIAAGNQDLSQRSQEQASALEETASTIEQMTSNIKANADNSQVANQISQEAVKAAHAGEEVVQKTVISMEEVNKSSQKISEIIMVVNDIAFQTNLLALNAAVEAARAGEQGRGFAVVAGEVRVLAGRAAEAAKEIKHLINESVSKVRVGNQLVEETGKNLNEIINHINQVAEKIQEISSATKEQSGAIDQVNLAVTQIDEVVQQNASLVEEAAATSENLSGEAGKLEQMMSKFKLNSKSGFINKKNQGSKREKTTKEISLTERKKSLKKVDISGFQEF